MVSPTATLLPLIQQAVVKTYGLNNNTSALSVLPWLTWDTTSCGELFCAVVINTCSLHKLNTLSPTVPTDNPHSILHLANKYRTPAVVWTALYGNYVICDFIVRENTNVVHFSCDIGKYITCLMRKVFAQGLTPYSLSECCIFPYRAQMNTVNWARRTFWGWWDECDDTALQTQDSKFEPWRSKAEHATSR